MRRRHGRWSAWCFRLQLQAATNPQPMQAEPWLERVGHISATRFPDRCCRGVTVLRGLSACAELFSTNLVAVHVELGALMAKQICALSNIMIFLSTRAASPTFTTEG